MLNRPLERFVVYVDDERLLRDLFGLWNFKLFFYSKTFFYTSPFPPAPVHFTLVTPQNGKYIKKKSKEEKRLAS
jgi:hypothetical protein